MKLFLSLMMVVAMSSNSLAAINTSSTPKAAMACKHMAGARVFSNQITASPTLNFGASKASSKAGG